MHSNRSKTEHPFAVRVAHVVGRTWARINYGRRVEPTWLELNPHSIPVADLPQAFAGFKIAHLSDLHHGHHLPDDFLPKAVDLTMAQQPDLIALTGDFIHKGYKHVEEVAKVLARLQAPHGVFAVLGNHDFSVRNALGFRRHRGLPQAIADALGSQGIRVLRNETLQVERKAGSPSDRVLPGTTARKVAHSDVVLPGMTTSTSRPAMPAEAKILLAGLDDLWSRECDPHLALEGHCSLTPRIVLAHNPQTIHLMDDHRCDLMLSGHTHGGQINWPGLGRFLLGRKGRQFAAGLYQHKTSHLYVHKGVGFGWRFRYGVRPEIAMHTLRRAH
jgi:predicted MPP superfamily phosphohydrolase